MTGSYYSEEEIKEMVLDACNRREKTVLKRVKKIILSHARPNVRHYEDSWDIRPSILLEELGL